MAGWTIQSISYPNPFGERETEWRKLEEFVGFESYLQARTALTPREHQRMTKVETMKAAYESFGLLWVDGDKIRVTPGGRQYIDAVQSGNQEEAAWIGLNLLLRCPLAGPRGNWSHPDSDLPIYWGILAVMLDADGELYWEELGRALAWVTARGDLQQAVDTVRALRTGALSLSEVEPPGDHYHGNLYNRLNMAMYHVGLGRMLTERVNDARYVEQGGKPRADRIRDGWQRQLIETALGGAVHCDSLPTGSWVDRVPAALDVADVEERFEILGAAVPPPQSAPTVASARLGDDIAWMVDPARMTVSGMRITGLPSVVCGMAVGHHVALRGEAQRTFKIKSKRLAGDGVEVVLRPARRISNPARVENAFKEIYDA